MGTFHHLLFAAICIPLQKMHTRYLEKEAFLRISYHLVVRDSPSGEHWEEGMERAAENIMVSSIFSSLIYFRFGIPRHAHISSVDI